MAPDLKRTHSVALLDRPPHLCGSRFRPRHSLTAGLIPADQLRYGVAGFHGFLLSRHDDVSVRAARRLDCLPWGDDAAAQTVFARSAGPARTG
jgi:hypothetical protein